MSAWQEAAHAGKVNLNAVGFLNRSSAHLSAIGWFSHSYPAVVWPQNINKSSVWHNRLSGKQTLRLTAIAKPNTVDRMCYNLLFCEDSRNTSRCGDIIIFLNHKSSMCKMLLLCRWQRDEWQSDIFQRFAAVRTNLISKHQSVHHVLLNMLGNCITGVMLTASVRDGRSGVNT